MSVTIIGELFLINENDMKETLNFIKKAGFMSDRLKKGYNSSDKYLYSIELKNETHVIDSLMQWGFFKKRNVMYISKMSELGITIYAVDQYMGDGYIFIPINNINCIHTIDEKNIIGLITQEDEF